MHDEKLGVDETPQQINWVGFYTSLGKTNFKHYPVGAPRDDYDPKHHYHWEHDGSLTVFLNYHEEIRKWREENCIRERNEMAALRAEMAAKKAAALIAA